MTLLVNRLAAKLRQPHGVGPERIKFNVQIESTRSTMSVALVPETETAEFLESGKLIPTILQRIAAGDATAVDECLEQYGGLVWSLAKQLTRNQDDAEDAAQEVFVELWQKAHAFSPSKSSETTFIAMVARRRLIDRLRRDERQPMTASVSSDAIDLSEPAAVDPAELADEAAKAARCLEKLSKEQQGVITLSVHHGLSHKLIAEKLSMPLGTVKSYARRALLQLRDCMMRSAVASNGGAS